MNDEDIIKLAQSKEFKFIKHVNSWVWSVIAPDNDCFVSEKAEDRMKWLKTKLFKINET